MDSNCTGLQVFRSDATQAKDFLLKPQACFPIRLPSYNGPITIKGIRPEMHALNYGPQWTTRI